MIAAQEQLIRSQQLTSRSNWKLVAFYFGVPVIIAIYGAVNNWKVQQDIGFSGTLVFYLAHAFVPWWITCISTYGLMGLLRRWQPSHWVLIFFGALLGCLFTIPYTNWITQLFENKWPGNSHYGLITDAFSTEFFVFFLRVAIIWFFINYLFDRFVDLPRYRYARDRNIDLQPIATDSGLAPNEQKHTEQIITQPAFLARLPEVTQPTDVLSIQAEQHYIRVHTTTKEHLILYRFSDAIHELSPELGMQVHRSWWVAKSAIESIQHGAKKFFIQLESGTTIPVSTPYQGMVKELARSSGIPIRPAPASKISSS